MAMQAKNSDSREEVHVHKAQIKTSLRKKYINKYKKSSSPPTGRMNQGKKHSPVPTEVSNSSVGNAGSNSDAR